MKSHRVSFDFSDDPKILELLRNFSAASGKSQKSIVIEALKSHFAEKMETRMLWRAAEQTFSDWDNEDDEVYNDL